MCGSMDTKEGDKRDQAFENKCIRKRLSIPWARLVTNKQVYEMVQVESEILSHVMILPHDSIESCAKVGLVECTRGRGMPIISWLNNIKNWTGLTGASLLQATRYTGPSV